jgi:hypothetical protein
LKAKRKRYKRKKRPSVGFRPADGLGSFRLPEASDGDGYNDPDNNNDWYGEGRGNSACEAVEHCQKFQFKRKVFEMQASVNIKDIYNCIPLKGPDRLRPSISPRLGSLRFENFFIFSGTLNVQISWMQEAPGLSLAVAFGLEGDG